MSLAVPGLLLLCSLLCSPSFVLLAVSQPNFPSGSCYGDGCSVGGYQGLFNAGGVQCETAFNITSASSQYLTALTFIYDGAVYPEQYMEIGLFNVTLADDAVFPKYSVVAFGVANCSTVAQQVPFPLTAKVAPAVLSTSVFTFPTGLSALLSPATTYAVCVHVSGTINGTRLFGPAGYTDPYFIPTDDLPSQFTATATSINAVGIAAFTSPTESATECTAPPTSSLSSSSSASVSSTDSSSSSSFVASSSSSLSSPSSLSSLSSSSAVPPPSSLPSATSSVDTTGAITSSSSSSGAEASSPGSASSSSSPFASSSSAMVLVTSSSLGSSSSSSSSSGALLSSSSSSISPSSSTAPIVSVSSASSSGGVSSSSSVLSASSGSSAPSTSSGVSVLGDPQFVGLRGQSFQVHGIDGAVYSIISDRGMLVNARFRYLSSGRCPVAVDTSNCWSHPGSYLGEVGVVSAAGAKLHIASGSWSVGFDSVTLDGAALPVGSNVSVNGLTAELLTAHSLRVRAGNFELLLHNSDRFINIVETRVLRWSELASHGLLGQTWRAPRDGLRARQLAHIEGEVDDYVEANNELLGSAFLFGAEADDAVGTR